jgi:hypothetical protein
MVDIVGAITSAQNLVLKPGVQDTSAPTPAPPPPLSSIDFVTSGIHVDNLQNIAILEYRSSQTGEVIQQYPNQAQINAFKTAQSLAHAAELQHQAVDHHAAVDAHPVTTGTTGGHVSVPHVSTGSGSGSSSAGSAGSAGKSTTSIVA